MGACPTRNVAQESASDQTSVQDISRVVNPQLHPTSRTLRGGDLERLQRAGDDSALTGRQPTSCGLRGGQ